MQCRYAMQCSAVNDVHWLPVVTALRPMFLRTTLAALRPLAGEWPGAGGAGSYNRVCWGGTGHCIIGAEVDLPSNSEENVHQVQAPVSPPPPPPARPPHPRASGRNSRPPFAPTRHPRAPTQRAGDEISGLGKAVINNHWLCWKVSPNERGVLYPGPRAAAAAGCTCQPVSRREWFVGVVEHR